MRAGEERPIEEGSSPSDGEITLVERAILELTEEFHKLKERVGELEKK